MGKLSIFKSPISPKRTGATKNLLKRDGITSDDIDIKDDGSSSFSDRQEKKKSKNKKKFGSLRLFRRSKARNGEEDDGYESDASQSSLRSTSSSFLRYQNRAIWRAKLIKKAVLQRRGDGSETPLEEETKPWPMFDKIYKRQNQLKKGDIGEDEDREFDDDSVSSVGSTGEDRELGPPAPIITFEIEEEELLEGIEKETQEHGVGVDVEDVGIDQPDRVREYGAEAEPSEEEALNKVPSSIGAKSSPDVAAETKEKSDGSHEDGKVVEELNKTKEVSLAESISQPESTRTGVISPTAVHDIDSQVAGEKELAGTQSAVSPTPNESHKDSLDYGNSLIPDDSHPPSVQESGIPTSEAPKESSVAPSAIPSKDAPNHESGASKEFPTQKLNRPLPLNATSKQTKSKRGPRASHGKNGEQGEIAPRSIPRTICYSLRSAIGDGSARQRNSHSLMERRLLRPNGCHLDTSYWSHRGKRNYMEDRFVIEHIGSINKHESNSKPISLLAVFDGHGGSAASQFCSDWLSSYVRKKNDHYPDNLALAMKTAFTRVDDDFVDSGHFDGTTACACAVVGKKVICCNAGDSRAIIVKRDGTAVALSEDHKPDRDDETKRINDLGGRVIHWGRWRVEGVLAVSRSIGDAKLKPYVTAEPDVVEHYIDEDDMFLVIASDGVWDTMSSDLVAKFVLVNTCKIIDKGLQVDEKLLRWIARQVSKRARENGSSDNISCIVAKLNDD
mmetsp:Transcript_12286/g.26159  ORF Transcript_12286/g.26159 Transcript_12286/m.26159 type:complete len:730 (+) Transcript_12286:298-2487(+)|eukprot:CAMPEP_0183718052 /NCGR_PEP_ID=MMETSP0737-20130205/11409_1 /TAXON_ID=385413 /ORGANISM="Thalassiosira miniscula, Strain CCMP1093" /LENGTH=729 /DNA_ID=CAMNT_0025947533 /DNA_START=278 /DNA_END=2467 /DNA_ORIENTATION=+